MSSEKMRTLKPSTSSTLRVGSSGPRISGFWPRLGRPGSLSGRIQLSGSSQPELKLVPAEAVPRPGEVREVNSHLISVFCRRQGAYSGEIRDYSG